MLNALWLNAQELNAAGAIRRVVFLGGAGLAGASASVECARQKGLASSVTASADGAATSARVRTVAAFAVAGAELAASVYRTRAVGGTGIVFASATLGSSENKLLSAIAFATASGKLYPYDALLGSDITAGASATATLTKIRALSASSSLGASVVIFPVKVNRRMFADVTAGAAALADPDVFIAHVKYVGLSANVLAKAAAAVAIDPRKNLAASVTVSTHTSVQSVQRTRAIVSISNLAGALSDILYLQSVQNLSAAATAGASDATAVYRTRRIFAQPASAGAAVVAKASARRVLTASGDAGAQVLARIGRRTGLASKVDATASGFSSVKPAVRLGGFAELTSSAIASIRPAIRLGGAGTLHSEAIGEVRLAEKLYGAGAAGASARADMIRYRFIQIEAEATAGAGAKVAVTRNRRIFAQANAGAKAIALLLTNIFDHEPDYRTLVIDAGDFTLTVDPQDFTITVTDDNNAMKTFSKQPHEVLAYDIDLAPWLAPLDGDDLETCTVVVRKDGVVVTGPTELTVDRVLLFTPATIVAGVPGATQAYAAKVWLSKGIDGTVYQLTATFTTEGGRTKEVDFRMKIKEI